MLGLVQRALVLLLSHPQRVPSIKLLLHLHLTAGQQLDCELPAQRAEQDSRSDSAELRFDCLTQHISGPLACPRCLNPTLTATQICLCSACMPRALSGFACARTLHPAHK